MRASLARGNATRAARYRDGGPIDAHRDGLQWAKGRHSPSFPSQQY
jgi:hypothetical protein